MPKIAIRIRKNGEIYVMIRNSNGNFEFGDPKNGDRKHLAGNCIERANIDDAFKLIELGYHPRMLGTKTNQFNMISPEKVQIINVPE